MRKRNYSKRQLLWICLISIAMLAAAVILNRVLPPRSKPASVTPAAVTAAEKSGSQIAAHGQEVYGQVPGFAGELAEAEEISDLTEGIATWLQGPRSWKERREWSGKWGKTYYDGGSFGGFGCGLCCMANIYCSLTDYRCSPIDIYEYSKKVTEYEGGGAIDWGYMKQTLEQIGFDCSVGNKPDTYEEFQELVRNSQACIVVVSSQDSTCYWKNTPGHYVTLFLYDDIEDKIFLADSGDPDHNRHWVPLKKIYRSLKMANRRQYLAVAGYQEQRDQWKNRDMDGIYVLPESWEEDSPA